MKMITPVEISDTNMTSTIPEPDPSFGEVEWVDTDQVISFIGYSGVISSAAVAYGDYVYYFAKTSSFTNVVLKLDTNSNSVTKIADISSGNFGNDCAVEYDGIIYAFKGGDNISVVIVDTSDDSVIENVFTGTVTGTVSGDYNGLGQADVVVLGVPYIFFGATNDSNGDNVCLRYRIDTGDIINTYSNSDPDKFIPVSIADGNGRIAIFESGGDIIVYKTTGHIVQTIYSGINDSISHGVLANNGYIYIICEDSSGSGLESNLYKVDPTDYTFENVATFDGSYSYIMKTNTENDLYIVSFDGDLISLDTSSGSYTIEADALSSAGFTNGVLANNGASFFFVIDDINKIQPQYVSGDRAILTSTHKLYQAISDTRVRPDLGVETVPPTWVEVSATNKYKAFDYTINTKAETSGSDNIEYQFTLSSPCTNIAVFGMENVTSVRVVVTQDGDTEYDTTKDTSSILAPAEDLLVNDTLNKSKVLFDDLPITDSPVITITFYGTNKKIGDIALGNARTIGVAVYESSTSRTSYDTVETDDFGNETIVSRPSAEYTTFEVKIPTEYNDYVEEILKVSLNKPRIWVGEKANDEFLFTFGYYERSPITYSSPMYSDTTLKIRGLV